VLVSGETVERPDAIPVSYATLAHDVRIDDRILLDDGQLELRVTGSEGDEVHARVVDGGLLRDGKGINLPGVEVSVESLTAKDLADIDFCIREEVDYLALSFVRRAADIEALQTILAERGGDFIRIIAKIEKPEAVADFDTILQAADAVMVARGDLGVEMSPEKVPMVQKELIRKCNLAGKPVITATQMLESMITQPRPTRAETSDVANAILDGTDAVMLSGETAIGAFPRETVAVMDRVARDVEGHPAMLQGAHRATATLDPLLQPTEAIGRAAARMAAQVRAAAILAFTQTGGTATLVAKYRPRLPIIAVTPYLGVQRRLALYHGVRSLQVTIEGNTESQIESVAARVVASGLLHSGDTVVLTMGSPLSTPGTTNLLKIHTLDGMAASGKR
jgi:pyruvate kinase